MISLHSYHLPFKTPLITGAGEFNERKGIIIRYHDAFVESLSEVAPLPGFSAESPDEARITLKKKQELIRSFFEQDYTIRDLKKFLSELPELPSLQFGISTLGADVLCKRNGITPSEIFNTSAAERIDTNKTVSSAPPEEIKRQIMDGLNQGFLTFKLKSVLPLEPLYKLIREVRSENTAVLFRLDANQSWTPGEFRTAEVKLSGLPIEYIEEPFRVQKPGDQFKLVNGSDIPIALDESVHNLGQLKTVLKEFPSAILIIKPMVYGNIFSLFETITSYRSLFNNIVITTALESAVGRKMVCAVASLMGDRNRAHGLQTGAFFYDDLITRPPVSSRFIEAEKEYLSRIRYSDLNLSLIKNILDD